MEGDGRVGGRRAREQPAAALGRPPVVGVEYSAEAAAYLVESISSCRFVIWGTALERGEQLGNAAARAGLVFGTPSFTVQKLQDGSKAAKNATRLRAGVVWVVNKRLKLRAGLIGASGCSH